MSFSNQYITVNDLHTFVHRNSRSSHLYKVHKSTKIYFQGLQLNNVLPIMAVFVQSVMRKCPLLLQVEVKLTLFNFMYQDQSRMIENEPTIDASRRSRQQTFGCSPCCTPCLSLEMRDIGGRYFLMKVSVTVRIKKKSTITMVR